MRVKIGVISACFMEERISRMVERWSSCDAIGSITTELWVGGGCCFYLPLVIPSVRNILQRTLERSLLVPALQQLSALRCESLDVAYGDRIELRGEELGGEGILWVESVDID